MKRTILFIIRFSGKLPQGKYNRERRTNYNEKSNFKVKNIFEIHVLHVYPYIKNNLRQVKDAQFFMAKNKKKDIIKNCYKVIKSQKSGK